MNPYELLLGAPPTSEEQIKAIAARLRGADDRAMLALLSGDQVLAPVGVSQMRTNQSTAQGLAKARQMLEERNARKTMFDEEWKIRQQESALDRQAAAEREARLANQAAQQHQAMMAQYEAQQARWEADAAIREEANRIKAEDIERKRIEAEAKARGKEEKYLGDETRRLSAKLNDEGITDVEAAIGQADTVMGKYIDVNTGERKAKDIPGYGAVVNMLPNFTLSDEGKELRRYLSEVRNLILKARSGAAVTEPEMNRLAEELGTALGQGETEMINAYVNLRKRFGHVKQGILAGYAPEVQDLYMSRMGANHPSRSAGAPNQTRRGTTYEIINEN